MSLHDLQRHWMDQLYAPARTQDASLPPGFDVYRNNLQGNMSDALRDCYPATQSLLGERFFHQCAVRYSRQHPSTSGDLHHFGSEFPDMVASAPGCESLPYLEDIARLEWMMHKSFHAADSQALTLQKLDPSILANPHRWLTSLQPSLHFCISSYPILRIWKVALQKSEDAVDLSDGSDAVLIIRTQGQVTLSSVPLPLAKWLQALQAGHSLEQATVSVMTETPDFDPQDAIGHLFSESLVSSISLTPN